LAGEYERVEHDLQRAERSGGNPAHENLAKRQPVETRSVDLLAWTFEEKIVEQALRAIVRNEYVIDIDVPASGGLQAGDAPGIHALVVGARQQKNAHPRRPAAFPGNHGAQQRPVAMLAAACVSPAAAQTMAAVDSGRLAGGHQGGADQCRVVAPPDFLRWTIVEQRQ